MSQSKNPKPLDKQTNPEEPLEDLPKEWQDEDIETEGRKPNLEETEDDEAAL